jgi:hypothetical protein
VSTQGRSIAEQQAADFVAPAQGQISVLSLGANTASAAQDTGIDGSAGRRSAFVTIGANETFFVLFDALSSMAAPDPTATSGTGRCMGPFAANAPVSLRVDASRRYFRAISASAVVVRWYLSSGAQE